MESFLWTGTPLAVLREDWKIPEMNDILKISTSWQEISFFSNFSILVSMVLDPTGLVESSEDIMRAYLSLLLGLKKNNFELYFFKKSEKCLWEYLIITLVWEAMEKN